MSISGPLILDDEWLHNFPRVLIEGTKLKLKKVNETFATSRARDDVATHRMRASQSVGVLPRRLSMLPFIKSSLSRD